jgi:hypothetical protein
MCLPLPRGLLPSAISHEIGMCRSPLGYHLPTLVLKNEPTFSKMMMSLEKLIHFAEMRRVEGTLLLTHLHLYHETMEVEARSLDGNSDMRVSKSTYLGGVTLGRPAGQRGAWVWLRHVIKDARAPLGWGPHDIGGNVRWQREWL